jgi:asparagine synthase (glutamine-hydrolysing)
MSLEEGLPQLDQVSKSTFGRLIRSLQGRCAVVALSGGYDSRYILAMLVEQNYNPILAYSYGRKGNAEMEVAARVAVQLGVEFIPIVYDENLIRNYERDREFLEWVDFSANFTSMFFMQEYFAVRYLRDHGLVPDDAVFIPGHSADFLAGSMFIKQGIPEKAESLSRTTRRILQNKYIYSKPALSRRARKRIRSTIGEKAVVEEASPWSVYEDWDLKEKFAKFIVNSCNVYAFHGYAYRLPFYDLEFMNFFRDLPFDLKSNKLLYDTYLREGLFRRQGLNYAHEIQPEEGVLRRANLKRKLKQLIPEFLLPARLPVADDIFYQEITAVLQKDMARHGVRIVPYRSSHNSLIISWYVAWLQLKFPHMVEG